MILFSLARRHFLQSHAFGASVRVTGYIIAPCLIVGNLVIVNPPPEEEPMFPAPRLDLVKYRSEKEYVFLAGA